MSSIKFSKEQLVSFVPLDFEQQAWYVDNTQRMLSLLEEFAENNNDTVVKHWCSQWRDSLTKLEKQCKIEY